MSQQQMSPTPPAKAAPLTRATVGFGRSFKRAQHGGEDASHRHNSRPRHSRAMRRIQLRSPPAEKAAPAPVSTSTRTASSAPSRRKPRSARAMSASSKALRRSGRLSVSVATPRASVDRRSLSPRRWASCRTVRFSLPRQLDRRARARSCWRCSRECRVAARPDRSREASWPSAIESEAMALS